MDNKMFEKETTILKKKHNFFEELFIKDIQEEDMASSEQHIVALQKQNSKLEKLSSGFGIISFVSLIALCISLNSSGKSSTQLELENNYQEVISQSLNLAPWQDTDKLATNLDNILNTDAALKTDKGSNILNYHVPSKFYSPGSDVKIEYKSFINNNDMISFTFPNLHKSGFGKLEKKVLLEKIQERNFPGYLVSVNNPKDGEALIAVFLKNHALQGSPVSKDITTSNVPVLTIPKLDLPPLYDDKDVTKSKILNTTIDNNPWSEKMPVLTKEEKEQLLKMRPGDI